MNKTELVSDLAARTGLSKTKADEVIHVLFDHILPNALVESGSVTLQGFGTLAVKHRAARVGVNPSTGASMQIAAKSVPVFRAGKTLKDRIARR